MIKTKISLCNNDINVIVTMHSTTKYAMDFYNMFKNNLTIVFDRCEVPPNYPGAYKTYSDNTNDFLAGKMRDIGAENILTDILFFDEDKLPTENPIPTINVLKHKYDVIIFLTEQNDQRNEKLDLTKPDNYVPITNYGKSNFVFTCGLYLNKNVIKSIKELNNGRIFHEAFDGRWGGEDDFLGDEIIACGYKIGYITNIKVAGSVSYVTETSDKLDDLNISNYKRYLLNTCLSDKFKDFEPYLFNKPIIDNINMVHQKFNEIQNTLKYSEEIYKTYKTRIGRTISLLYPKALTEKIQWLKLYDSTPLKTYCADKILIHEYCKTIIGEDICIPILKIYDSPNKIIFDDLPNSFVIKCNHGSHMNIMCSNKNELDIQNTINQLTEWYNTDYSSVYACELHYKNINRKIIVEPYINEKLTEYKFYCFNGEPAFCEIINNRYKNKTMTYFDLDWNNHPEYYYETSQFESEPNFPKPTNLTDMIMLAKKFAQNFIFVRVDLYYIHDKLMLNELTFTPHSGFHCFKDYNTDIQLGNLLKL